MDSTQGSENKSFEQIPSIVNGLENVLASKIEAAKIELSSLRAQNERALARYKLKSNKTIAEHINELAAEPNEFSK